MLRLLKKALSLLRKPVASLAFHFIGKRLFVIDNNLQYAQQFAIHPLLQTINTLQMHHKTMINNVYYAWPVPCITLNIFK